MADPADEEVLECKFFMPIVRDKNRQPHSAYVWKRLNALLFAEFSGSTTKKGLYVSLEAVQGEYDGVNGRVEDENKEYLVAIPRRRFAELRALLRRACNTFDQQCIYLVIEGKVEFVAAGREEGDL